MFILYVVLQRKYIVLKILGKVNKSFPYKLITFPSLVYIKKRKIITCVLKSHRCLDWMHKNRRKKWLRPSWLKKSC